MRAVAEPSNRGTADGTIAKLLVLALALAWGLNWPANKYSLEQVGPWIFRLVGLGMGGLIIGSLTLVRQGTLAIPKEARLHVLIAGLFNVGSFAIFATFALLGGGASRVIILVYTMPIWSSLLARVVLGEKLTPLKLLALALCVGGLAILLAPLMPLPPSVWFALATALSWSAGTVYMKWARIHADPLANTTWQIVVGLICVAAGMVVSGERWPAEPLHPMTLVAWAYAGVIGVGLAYLVWFEVVRRLPAATASLASLLVPVIGVGSSTVLLGEHLTVNDAIGFGLIFAAAACVLLQPSRQLAAAGVE